MNLMRLVQGAKRAGAGDASIIPSADIVVENDLANLCRSVPRCENYGMSPSCPPHVPGPPGFRIWQKQSEYSIVVRLDVPKTVMFSEECQAIMRLLHEIVSKVEKMACEMGYGDSKAFAGGSCRKIFCRGYSTCRVLAAKGECRNPNSARPSMSGFGINVSELMKTAGWPAKKLIHEKTNEKDSMTWIAGLVVLLKQNELKKK